MDEILFIDKPSGMTSFDVIRELRKKLGIRKMGHAGTLDPLATGLLIIALGSATKRINEFMNLPKEYEVLIEFGKVSNTYDADGEITEGTPCEVSRADFEKVLKEFLGSIQQMPPAYSAKKIKGERAYDLARKGMEVILEARPVVIHELEIVDWNLPLVRLRVACSKGTYIRSLAHDLGQKLGCGGYVKELRRTKIGEYSVEKAQKLFQT